MPHLFTDPKDIPMKGGDYYGYALLPQDYLSGSKEPSHFLSGLKRGQYEFVNLAGFSGEGKVYLAARHTGGTAPPNISWPAGTIIEEIPYSSFSPLNIETSHINAIQPPGAGYKDNCDQSTIRTCAEIIVGNPPDGLYVDPVGGPNAQYYGSSVNLRALEMFSGSYPHMGEIATHRFASISFDGFNKIPQNAQDGEVVNLNKLRLGIWEETGGSYLTAPMYSTGRPAEPQVVFPAIGGLYYPASGLFTRFEKQLNQGGYPAGGWMNGLKFANQYCWFDTPLEGQKQSTNRICINGGPSNTSHQGFEYDVWSGSRWVSAFQVTGKPDGTSDVFVAGNLTVGKTLNSRAGSTAGAMPASSPLRADAAPGSAVLSGTTGAIGGGLLLPGQCTTGTARVGGATSAMVATTSPVSDPGDGFVWQAYIPSPGIASVKVCALSKGTPKPVAYNVRVE
jgi:hypothetical protein